MLMYDINQRSFVHENGNVRWRISLTSDSPFAVSYRELIGLGMQLNLTQSEIVKIVSNHDFPAQLHAPGQSVRPLHSAQWAYKPAVAALLMLQKAREYYGDAEIAMFAALSEIQPKTD